jgi:F420-0:gamma-glutamyl ligase-like protein
MNGTKVWWKARRLQGLIVMALTMVATAAGLDIEAAQIEAQVAAVVGALGWLWSLYGSIVAEKQIGLRDRD